MAMTTEQLQQPLLFKLDVKDGLTQQPLRTRLMKGDKQANRIVVVLTDGNNEVDLTGVTVSGYFISPLEAAEIVLPGTAAGNVATVVLLDECYAEDGHFEAGVKLTLNGTARTIVSFTGEVLSRGSGAYIDIGNVIPSIDDIVAQYATMQRVTEATQIAAQNANAAAEDADNMAAAADTAAKAAETATEAANGWANATATAEMLDEDAEPIVDVTTAADGHKIIDFQIPRGKTGAAGKNFTILGVFDTYDDLLAGVPNPEQGDHYDVGKEAPYTTYMWDSVLGWVDKGSIGSGGSGLPDGGTAGQFLVKKSANRGDAEWKTPTAEDVGARPDTWMPTAEDVGAIDTTTSGNILASIGSISVNGSISITEMPVAGKTIFCRLGYADGLALVNVQDTDGVTESIFQGVNISQNTGICKLTMVRMLFSKADMLVTMTHYIVITINGSSVSTSMDAGACRFSSIRILK